MSGPLPPSGRRDCREQFKPAAASYRKWRRIFSGLFFVALSFWLLATFAGPLRRMGAMGFAAVCIGGMIAGAWCLRLVCPACRKNADRASGRFCPECGQDALRKKEFWSWDAGPHQCTACGARLASGRGGRRYRICFCRNCGAHLDDAGL